MAETKKKTCYVICPIGDEGGSIRKRSDTILKHLITPVVTNLGYQKPVRSDYDQKSDMITTGIITHLLNDDLIIADLTGRNPNVFYELGVRHLIQKPVVLLMQIDERPPFDTHDLRAIPIDVDVTIVEEAKVKLKERIESLEKAPQSCGSPVKLAITSEQYKSLKEQLVLEDMPSKQIMELLLKMVEEQSKSLSSTNYLLADIKERLPKKKPPTTDLMAAYIASYKPSMIEEALLADQSDSPKAPKPSGGALLKALSDLSEDTDESSKKS